jgi:hypothetical protein
MPLSSEPFEVFVDLLFDPSDAALLARRQL